MILGKLIYVLNLAWAMQTALFIFIKRKWIDDQNTFKKFIDYYNKIEKKFMVC